MATLKLTVPLYRNENDFPVGVPKPTGGMILIHPGRIVAGARYAQTVYHKGLSVFKPPRNLSQLLRSGSILDPCGELDQWMVKNEIKDLVVDSPEVEVQKKEKPVPTRTEKTEGETLPIKFAGKTRKEWLAYLRQTSVADISGEMATSQVQQLAKFLKLAVSGSQREMVETMKAKVRRKFRRA